MRRYGLRDDQWERIKDILPSREGYVGGTAVDNRLFVEAVLCRYRAGIPWRNLLARFGDWKNVHRRLGRWCKSGIIESGRVTDRVILDHFLFFRTSLASDLAYRRFSVCAGRF